MPGSLTPKQVREQIARGELEPLYLVTGDDDAEMSALASALADSVEEELRAFNVQRFYGTDSDTTVAEVLDAAGTFPLLTSRRVVLLMQAQVLLTGKKTKAAAANADEAAEEAEVTGAGKGSELSLLKEYAERPYAHAVVALFGRGLQRSFTALAKRAAVVTCTAPADILSTLEREHGVRFDEGARRLLGERAGDDVAKLRGEVERVALYAAGRTEIGVEQVRAIVAKPIAVGGWTLSNCVQDRRTADALRELRLELAEGASPYMLLGLLRSAAERSAGPRGLPRALDVLLRTDLAIKTSGGDPQVLLERLVVELCATGRD
jgi:DNA polymerase-3 subunit delta